MPKTLSEELKALNDAFRDLFWVCSQQFGIARPVEWLSVKLGKR
jgi:hypothetical protein